MIPKVIHYCWFGHNPKSELIKKCIESWKQYCPDYKIVEWNESNFDVNIIPYVKDAYLDGKYAFVSDYARLYIAYSYRGIYLDTDVLLRKDLDELLQYDCWLASDDVRYIATGLGFGCKKGNKTIKALMDAYIEYDYPSGTNVIRDTRVLEQIYPFWVKSDKDTILDNTLIIGLKRYGKYAKHLYTYSWGDESQRKQREEEILNQNENKLNVKVIWKIKCFLRSPKFIQYFDRKRGSLSDKIYTFIAYDLMDYGVRYYLKHLWKKIWEK